MKKTYISVMLFVVGICIAYFLLRTIDIRSLKTTFLNISWRLVFLAFMFYICANVLRAWRAHILLERNVPKGFLFWITLVQGFLNTFLPFGMGEAFFLGALRTSGYASVSRSAGSLIGARILDFLCLFILMLIAMLRLLPIIPHVRQLVVMLVVLIVLVIGGTMVLLFAGPVLVQRWDKLQNIVEGFQVLRSRRVAFATFAYSCAIWACLFASDIILLHSAGLQIGIFAGVFVISFPILANFIPTSLLGSYGIFEGAALIGFTILGIARETAIPVSFVVHTQSLVMLVIMAMVGGGALLGTYGKKIFALHIASKK